MNFKSIGERSKNIDCAKLLAHLSNASASVSKGQAAVDAHLKKAANMHDGIEDRSEDNSGTPGDLTSPGTIDRNPSAMTSASRQTSAPGDSDISVKAAMDSILIKSANGVRQGSTATGNNAKFRDGLVVQMYKAAAGTKLRSEQARIEKAAMQLDSLDQRDLDAMLSGEWQPFLSGDLQGMEKSILRVAVRRQLGENAGQRMPGGLSPRKACANKTVADRHPAIFG